MSQSSSSLPVTYHGALREYLARPGEVTLQQAYEVGRAAMSAGLGVFDVIRLHHQALNEDVAARDPTAIVRCAPLLEKFLLETLSPFEAAHRGFRRSWEGLEQLNTALAGHNEALALSNAQLEEEVTLRQRTEEQLRESKDHYFELFQKAHAMEESLRDLSAQILTAQEQERKRISRELHDELGQTLNTANVAIAILSKHATPDVRLRKKIAEAERLLVVCMEKVHAFACELRPPMLDDLGVHAALHSHVVSFTRTTKIAVKLGSHPELVRIDGQRGEVLFRVAQEALNNVLKHAHAAHVTIEFSATPEALRMQIADDGRAFSVGDKLGRPTGRLGLLGMQERVRLVHGTFAIESIGGRGTRVTVQIPFSSDAATPPPPDPKSNSHEDNISIAR